MFRTPGSPPRGRGIVALGLGRGRRGGITPAWAGNSLTLCDISFRSKDHPRVGGE